MEERLPSPVTITDLHLAALLRVLRELLAEVKALREEVTK